MMTSPPLSTTTNPVNNGSAWLDVDPATKVTRDGNQYYYEPWSLYVTLDDPAISDERLKGVRYCKLLSHQAILSWMLEKSFEENPVLITPNQARIVTGHLLWTRSKWQLPVLFRIIRQELFLR